jgi:hypothetical protein
MTGQGLETQKWKCRPAIDRRGPVAQTKGQYTNSRRVAMRAREVRLTGIGATTNALSIMYHGKGGEP